MKLFFINYLSLANIKISGLIGVLFLSFDWDQFRLGSTADRSPETFFKVLSFIAKSLSTKLLLISVMASKNYLKDRTQSSGDRF